MEQTEHWIKSPSFRADLTLLAYDEEEQPVGVCINEFLSNKNNAEDRKGYIATLGVKRPYRRRGLARALLLKSLHLMKDAQFTTATINVDAESPTGAAMLYESVGFTLRTKHVIYEKTATN